jgi:hypothetical protein
MRHTTRLTAAAMLALISSHAAAQAPVTTGYVIPTLADDGTPMPRSAGKPYAPKNLADRIVLTPGADPAREMAVAFRTNTDQKTAEAQITVAVDGPTLSEKAQTITGITLPNESSYGPALYHHIRFTGLTPDTVYAYRVKGAAGYSEWLQFRTAAAEVKPFRFLYLGDIQNGILTYASRVIRQAFHQNGGIQLVTHAGDLAGQRDDLDHDDEWGEWNEAGGYNYAITPQIPAAGNHEYVDTSAPDGSESRRLGPYFQLQFALPKNGAEGVKATTYYVDYQGVRFITMDGTSALDLGTIQQQTAWLDATLASSKAKWNIVLFHQPIYTCARPDDTSELKAAWKPIFDARNVDLVLQGHDHCYSRLTSDEGKIASQSARKKGGTQGPVYLVSVTGSKMYALNDRASTQPDKIAEATELYQIVDVAENSLAMRTYTATGQLYDGFTLTRRKDGRKLLTELNEPTLAARRCNGSIGPDGGQCAAKAK